MTPGLSLTNSLSPSRACGATVGSPSCIRAACFARTSQSPAPSLHLQGGEGSLQALPRPVTHAWHPAPLQLPPLVKQGFGPVGDRCVRWSNFTPRHWGWVQGLPAPHPQSADLISVPALVGVEMSHQTTDHRPPRPQRAVSTWNRELLGVPGGPRCPKMMFHGCTQPGDTGGCFSSGGNAWWMAHKYPG